MEQSKEQMKFLGTLGIFRQSFKTIFTSKKLFAQVTFTFIFPLAIIFNAHMDISNRFFSGIEQRPNQLIIGTNISYTFNYHMEVSQSIFLKYVLFKMATLATITIFSSLSMSVIVYTIASLYTGRDITFSEAIKVVPKVWKRLTITLLVMFLALFVWYLIYSVEVFLYFATGIAYVYTLVVIFIIYIHWSCYIMMVWELASVVSVLEESYGLKAAMRAMDLTNGKRGVAFIVSVMFYLYMDVVVFVRMVFDMNNNKGLALVWLWVIQILCFFLLVIGFLVIIVVQTMLYLVCKSQHQETVDLGNFSTHLGAYMNDQPV